MNADKLIEEIHRTVVKGVPANSKLVAAAQAVVVARHYTGEDGWDKLKKRDCGTGGSPRNNQNHQLK